MPRNGSGTYNLPSNSWFPAVNGVTATSTDWNTTAQDIQAALTQSVSADGQTPMTGNLQMGNNKVTGLANGTAATDAATFGQMIGRLIGTQSFTSSGTYTPTAGTSFVIVEAVGGGGAGGGAAATSAGNCSVGGGGSAGTYLRARINSGFSGAAVVVGAGGTGVAGAAGNSGGQTTFGGTLVVCPGGPGGSFAGNFAPPLYAQGAANGSLGSTTGIGLGFGSGSGGAPGICTTATTGSSGNGGDSHFSGGASRVFQSNGLSPGANTGAGGSGAHNPQSDGSTRTGGAGGSGFVVIYEYC